MIIEVIIFSKDVSERAPEGNNNIKIALSSLQCEILGGGFFG